MEESRLKCITFKELKDWSYPYNSEIPVVTVDDFKKTVIDYMIAKFKLGMLEP